jgi:biotin carboxyl carrier protein
MPLQTAVSSILLALILFLLATLLVWGLVSLLRNIPESKQAEGVQPALFVAASGDVLAGGSDPISSAPAGVPTQAPLSRRALTVLSPRNGVIRTLSVTMGERVEFGQELCVLESDGQMTAIRAGHTGVIASILVTETDLVKSGETIMEYAAPGG